MLQKLKDKKIYITPYNDLTVGLKKYLSKNNIMIQSIIDNSKEGEEIIKMNEIQDYDFIIIMSPNYYEEISKEYTQSKVIYANLLVDKYIFTDNQKEYKKNVAEAIEVIKSGSLYQFNLEGYKYYSFTNLHYMLTNTLSTYKDLLSFYNIEIKKNDVVIDIGTHHGLISIYSASFGAEVYSYEPNPNNYAILKKNIDSNPSLKLNIYNNAVSNTNETLELCFGHTSTTGSLKHLEFEQHTLKKDMSNSIDVKCIRLKDIIDKFSKIKLLKIDCEGCEYESFLTLDKKSLSKVQYILLEAHTTNEFNPHDMESILNKFGFEFITYSKTEEYKEYICKNLNWK